MKAAFKRWGNSLALRVPKPFASDIGARAGQVVDMIVQDGKLVIEVWPPSHRKRRYSLDELVAGITAENRHGPFDWDVLNDGRSFPHSA